MTYRILPTREFADDLKGLDAQARRRVLKKIEQVAEDPTRHKRLRGPLRRHSRVRIGPYRIVFSFDQRRRELYPEKIITDHRYPK